MTNRYDVIVIGGGAAGMMAALFAAREGAKALLLERNEKLGKKIYITGKGRCNLTNAADMDEFMKNIVRNPRFLYAALSKLDNQATMALFEQLGVPLKQERGERVFPVSDHASDITKALEKEMARLGVRTRVNARVQSLVMENGRCTGVTLQGGEVVCANAVILATGGLSYPATGSTGDGHKMARDAGHGIKRALPALAAIETVESWPKSLMGLTLKNVRLSCLAKKKKLYSEQGELLFTHFGISGPLALTLSSLLPEELMDVKLFIDLKPALDEQQLDARILRDFKSMPNKLLASAMDLLEPHSLGMQILALLNLSPALPIHSVSQTDRRALAGMLKRLPLTPKGTRGFEEAIITRGGVDVKFINPSTMESKLVPGLFFAGELIDVDALTGGFNLQIAFSTGALAGASAGAPPPSISRKNPPPA